MQLAGLVSGEVVEVLAVCPVGESACEVVFRESAGTIDTRVVSDEDLRRIQVVGAAESQVPYDADPRDFMLAAEALRIKYAALYDIAGILSGKEEADAARLKKTGFDEKLSFIALLSSAIGERVRKWQEEFRVQQEIFRILKEIRDAEAAGQTAVTEALREARFAAEQRLLREQAAHGSCHKASTL